MISEGLKMNTSLLELNLYSEDMNHKSCIVKVVDCESGSKQ